MSRVEPKPAEPQNRESRERESIDQPADRTPGKAEGDEQTVDEALRNQRGEEPRPRE